MYRKVVVVHYDTLAHLCVILHVNELLLIGQTIEMIVVLWINLVSNYGSILIFVNFIHVELSWRILFKTYAK